MSRTNLCVMGCLLAGLAGCTTELPGEAVGTFEIAMKLEQNTCGESAVYVTDGVKFSAELRTEGDRCYWRVPEQPIIEGELDGEHCRFRSSSVVATNAEDVTAQTPPLIVPDPTMQQPADGNPQTECQLIQTVDLVTTLDGQPGNDAGAGDSDAGTGSSLTLAASYQLQISPSSRTACVVAVMPEGPFEALPCNVVYQLSGEQRDSFD